MGRVPANTAQTTANWTAYPGEPHAIITGAELLASSAKVGQALSIPISQGDLVALRLVNNLTVSAAVTPTTGMTPLYIFSV